MQVLYKLYDEILPNFLTQTLGPVLVSAAAPMRAITACVFHSYSDFLFIPSENELAPLALIISDLF
jgi:hypothetical protein